METDRKKQQAQELTTANYNLPDLCEKKTVASIPTPAVDFTDEKIFSVASPVDIQKWLCVCSCDYHDVTSLPSANQLLRTRLTDGITCCLKAGLLGSGVCGPWHKD